jgi:hypothetical protein
MKLGFLMAIRMTTTVLYFHPYLPKSGRSAVAGLLPCLLHMTHEFPVGVWMADNASSLLSPTFHSTRRYSVPNSNPNFEQGAAHLHTSSRARLDSNFDKMAGEIIVRIGTTESEFS